MFGHDAEKADPTVGINLGSNVTINDYPLPAPVYQGTSSSTLPATSFNALTTDNIAGQPTNKQLRIYNGTVANAATDITYENGSTVSTTAATSEAILRVKFTATTNHVLFAWGGHIAAEFDWPGQSAQFINGSPYHCRIKNLLNASGAEIAKGSTDRSLKTDAIFRPATCAVTAAQTVCQGAASPLTYSFTGDQTGITNYKWVLSSNTVGVKIQGDNAAGDSDPTVGTVSGGSFSSVNIIPGSGTAFATAGSFSLALTLTNAGGTSEPCTTTGTINQAATAEAGDNLTSCQSSTAQSIALTGNGANVGGGATSGTWTIVSSSPAEAGNTLSDNTLANGSLSVAANYVGVITLRLTSNDPDGTGPCSTATDTRTVTISSTPGQPTAAVQTPLCTDLTMTVNVTLPSGLSSSATVTLRQASGGASPITKNASDAVNGVLSFTGLTFGKGYSITITDNVSTINPAGCTSTPLECGITGGLQTTVNSSRSSVTDQQILLQSQGQPSVIAAPNPFNDRIRFSMKSDISGRGSLELYNMLGQKVKTVFQGYVEKGMTKTIEYNVPGPQRQNLIYLFRVGDQKVSGKLIGLK